LRLMGLVAKDVRWAVNAADRDAAPWFGLYEGRRSLANFVPPSHRSTSPTSR